MIGLHDLFHASHIVPHTLKCVCQFNGIFKRQLGARANREVRGVSGIAHQHIRHFTTIGGSVPMHPLIANDPRKLDPMGRASQVLGIGHEGMTLQIGGKQLFAKGNRFFLRHVLKASCLPNRLWCFHNEGGGVAIKLISMRLKPAVLGFFNGKGEGIKQFARAQPNKAAITFVNVGLVGTGKARAHSGVNAITSNDQIGLVHGGYVCIGIDFLLEQQLNAQLFTTLLQNVQQTLSTNATKAMTTRTHGLPFEMHRDVIPMVERS